MFNVMGKLRLGSDWEQGNKTVLLDKGYDRRALYAKAADAIAIK